MLRVLVKSEAAFRYHYFLSILSPQGGVQEQRCTVGAV